jgi:hypothetical protein
VRDAFGWGIEMFQKTLTIILGMLMLGCSRFSPAERDRILRIQQVTGKPLAEAIVESERRSQPKAK